MNSPFMLILLVLLMANLRPSFAQETPLPDNLDALTLAELDNLLRFHKYEGHYKDLIPLSKVALKKAALAVGEQDTLYARMLYYAGLGEHHTSYDPLIASEYYEQAMAIQKVAIPTKIDYAFTLQAYADIFWYSTGEYNKAEPFLIEAKNIIQKAVGKEDLLYADAIAKLGTLYKFMGRYEKTESLLIEALEIVKNTHGIYHPNYESWLSNLGNLYLNTDKKPEALKIFLESKSILAHKKNKNSDSYSQVLKNLGVIYQRMGQDDDAEDFLLEAKKILVNLKHENSPEYVSLLNSLSILYQQLGEYEQAEPLLLQSMEIISNAIGTQNPRYASLINNLANLYKNLNRYKDAEHYYLEAIALWKATANTMNPSYASSLKNLGELYSTQKKYTLAESIFQEALVIKRKTIGEQHPDYGSTLVSIANLYKNLNQPKKAEQLYFQAAEIFAHSLGIKSPNYAKILGELAMLNGKNNRLDTALSYAFSSLAANSDNFELIFPNLLLTQDGERKNDFNHCCNKDISVDYKLLSKLNFLNPNEANHSLKILWSILKKQEQLLLPNSPEGLAKTKETYLLCQATIHINEQIKNDFSGNENKLRILKENSFFISSGIESALALNAEVHIQEAFSFAEQNKSILLSDALKGNKARNLGDLPDSLARLEIELQQKKEKIQKLKANANSKTALEPILKQENELNISIKTFVKSLQDKYPKYHAQKYANISAKATDIQTILDDNSLFLEYYISDSLIYLFAIDKTNVALFPLNISKSNLSKQIKILRKALSDYKFINKNKDQAYTLYTNAAHWFYNKLLAPAIKDKNVQNLIIVTDGELGHLPFETFLQKSAAQGKNDYKSLAYLVNDYNISYDYSATLFVEAHRNHKKTKTSNFAGKGKILACAANYPEPSKIIDSALLALRAPHLCHLRGVLQPLPNAQEEVALLSENFQGKFLFNSSQQSSNTSEAYFKKNAHQYSIMHLAMHGILHPRTAMLSSLAFTEDKDSLEDNFLQAYEIAHLHLNADLVVLSACETGFGKFEQGEGIISLGRSFMYAGTPSLVVSLWQVNDASTALIMEEFYRYLSTGKPKDVALRQAKLDYLKKATGIAAHPAFWSPFIQLGDATPIELKTKGSNLLWIITGLGFFIVLFVFIIWKKKTAKLDL